jgi:hypothetical protein
MEKIVTNPFQVGGMIHDEGKFFGRKREIREILSRVATMQSVSLVGERRIGKSSLLHHLTQHGSEFLEDKTIRFHRLDLQPLTSPEEFYENACKLISGQPGKTTHEDLEEAIRNQKIVLCLDEFEQAIEAGFGEDFFNSLRSLAQNGHLALIVSTKRPLSEIYRHQSNLTSSFDNIFTTLRLGEFTDEEVEGFLRLQRERKIFDTQECDLIRRLAGNHPRALNLACSIAFELKQESSKQFEQELTDRFNRERQAEESSTKVLYLSGNITPTGELTVEKEDSILTRVLILILIGLAIGGVSARNSNLLGIVIAAIFFGGAFFLMLFNSWGLRKESR